MDVMRLFFGVATTLATDHERVISMKSEIDWNNLCFVFVLVINSSSVWIYLNYGHYGFKYGQYEFIYGEYEFQYGFLECIFQILVGKVH